MATDDISLGRVLSSELTKVTRGTYWIACLLFGIVLATMSVVGSAVGAEESVKAGMPMADVTVQAIRFWFMVLLASSLFGVLSVTREYGNGSMARSVLLSGSRTRLFLAKLIVTSLVGLIFAIATIGMIALSTWLVVPLSGEAAVWSTEATKTSIGVFAVVFAGAPWGTALGWIIRSRVAAVAVLLVLTLVVDEGLFRIAPSVGKYMLQTAMAGVYLDDREDLLSVTWGAVVMSAWIVVAIAVGWYLFRRLDVK